MWGPAQGPSTQRFGARLPWAVLGACILWIVYGALGVLGSVASHGASTHAKAFQIVIGAIFIIAGVQGLKGKVSNVLAGGVVCMIVVAFSVIEISDRTRILTPNMLLNIALLSVAGLLACVGNKQYKRWVASRR